MNTSQSQSQTENLDKGNKMNIDTSNKDLKAFDDYLTLKELADSTIKQYHIFYNLFPKDNITPETVSAFLLEHRGNLPRAFVRNYLDFRKIHDIKIPVRTGRRKKRLPPKLTEEEIRRLRYALYKKNIKYGLMFDLTLDGALRRAEVINMTPQMFDWDGWAKDESKPIRVKVVGKGNKERMVIMSPKTANRVKLYLKPLLKEYLVKMDTRMFDIGVHTWWLVLKEVSEDVLGKRIKCHAIRHHRSSELYETGKFDLLDLSRFLGHASISTTQIYLHPDEEKSIQKFEGFFEEEAKK